MSQTIPKLLPILKFWFFSASEIIIAFQIFYLLYIYMHVCICVSIYMQVVYIWIYMAIYICMYGCVSIYTHTYMHIYIHMYIYNCKKYRTLCVCVLFLFHFTQQCVLEILLGLHILLLHLKKILHNIPGCRYTVFYLSTSPVGVEL